MCRFSSDVNLNGIDARSIIVTLSKSSFALCLIVFLLTSCLKSNDRKQAEYLIDYWASSSYKYDSSRLPLVPEITVRITAQDETLAVMPDRIFREFTAYLTELGLVRLGSDESLRNYFIAIGRDREFFRGAGSPVWITDEPSLDNLFEEPGDLVCRLRIPDSALFGKETVIIFAVVRKKVVHESYFWNCIGIGYFAFLDKEFLNIYETDRPRVIPNLVDLGLPEWQFLLAVYLMSRSPNPESSPITSVESIERILCDIRMLDDKAT